MSLCRLSIFAALAFALTACPTPNPTPDANDVPFVPENPTARDACSGGCAGNQLCDTATRTCRDACGGCDAGICVKVSEGLFECRERAVTCGGNLCDPGQVACLGGACSCLSSLSGALDTCQVASKWCNGKVCTNPKAFEQCTPGSTTAMCPTGYACQRVFGEDMAICTKICSDVNPSCGRGEVCSDVGCLPLGLFSNQECNQHKPAADGGWERADGGAAIRLTVPVSNTCLLKNGRGEVTDVEGKGNGNCTYAVFKFWNDGVYPFDTCRPPGNATEGQPCKDDYANGAIATQCGTGLQCAQTKGNGEGVCLRMCNAQPPSFGINSQPSCNTDEACVNTLRYTDPNSNAVLGVCMKKCHVFDATKNTCANVGTTASSCVPTEASGELAVSPSGEGVCIPQQATVAQLGAQCAETDSFRGATCASGQLCTSMSADQSATCTGVCDLDCNPADGGTGPARCATEPAARCGAGKTCRRVTSTVGARVGFCL